MYHAPMRTQTTRLLTSGPFLGVCYLLAWLALWPTEQPYWMLPFGLRFGALLLTPVRQWPWLLGLELGASAVLEIHQDARLG